MAAMQRYDSTVTTNAGVVVPNASVAVLIRSTGAEATIYLDEGTTPITNPITTAIDGRFWFYAADDDYRIEATYGGVTQTLGDVTLHAPEAWRTHVAKVASVPVNNSVVYKDDEELVFNVLTGETWEFSYVLSLTTTVAADFKFRINTTPGVSGSGYTAHVAYETATTFTNSRFTAVFSTNNINFAGVVTAQPVLIHGYIIATADATVDLQWAQRAAAVADTHVNIGSYLIARKASLA